MNNSGIKDNFSRGSIGEFLKKIIKPHSQLSIVSAYFTMYAYEALKGKLDNIEHLDLLFGEPTFISQVKPSSDKKVYKIEDDSLEIPFENRLYQKKIAKECAKWLQNKASIRSMVKPNFLHGKMYHVINQNETESAIIGSSNFTKNGLGFGPKPNIELNLELNDRRDIEDLHSWFNEIWESDYTEDVKQKFLDYLQKLYSDNSPEFIYYKTLYHLFEQYIDEQSEGGLLNESVGFFETEIWKMLYDFQKDGIIGAINKILQHNGCIIADSVGLGKTFEALAVIKYFLLLNYRVLVLCPKKLHDNWTQFRADVDAKYNLLASDKFEYTVLSHTDLSRQSGFSDGKNLATFNWSNYDLVVIDESHNFRNYSTGTFAEDGTYKQSRYNRLLDTIIKEGVQTKILLLSATPVNNNLKDLRNQIYLITEEKDDALEQYTGIRDIGEILRVAQAQFTDWVKKRKKDKVSNSVLYEKLDSSFFKLLDVISIARSRKHIVDYYNINNVGNFPERKKPISIYPELDTTKQFPSYDVLNSEILKFHLSLYNPSKYIKKEFREEYQKKASGRMMIFDQETREHFLIGMMRVNFLKRLESSIESFEISMQRTIDKIIDLIKKIEDFKLTNSLGDVLQTQSLISDDEIDEDDNIKEASDLWQVGTKLKFDLSHLKVDKWKKELERDYEQLKGLYEAAKSVTPDRDEKLKILKDTIKNKVENPINTLPGLKDETPVSNKKIAIFTAFADTADYLYENLKDWAQEEHGLHIAMVTGGNSNNKSTFKPTGFKRQTKYNNILKNFSPRSKYRKKNDGMPQEDEIDILIATDCISEGQNLQDCDYLINYDIHWNPVRIIQRFGRIDRLESTNKEIQLVNFWPTDNLNKYINLTERVKARMALVDITATGDDNVLDLKKKETEEILIDEWKFREKQLQRLKEEVLDLEDIDDNVSLTDFTLDDFRIDLSNFIKNNQQILKDAPLGLYALAPSPEGKYKKLLYSESLSEGAKKIILPGVIFCLRQSNTTSETSVVNPLSPFFLIYIRNDGEVKFNFTNPKQILEMYKLLCKDITEPYEVLCDLFNSETANGNDMVMYSDLTIKAIKAVMKVFKKRNARRLCHDREAVLLPYEQQSDSTDDFELITWLVIK